MLLTRNNQGKSTELRHDFGEPERRKNGVGCPFLGNQRRDGPAACASCSGANRGTKLVAGAAPRFSRGTKLETGASRGCLCCEARTD